MTIDTSAKMPLTEKKTAKAAIIERLSEPGIVWLAVHELAIWGHSQNALATELSTMARNILVVGRFRAGERFKEWRLLPVEEGGIF